MKSSCAKRALIGREVYYYGNYMHFINLETEYSGTGESGLILEGGLRKLYLF